MGVQGVGHRWAQVELPHLRVSIARDKLDGGLHFGNHSLGFVEALQASLTETFLLYHAANRVNLCGDICGNEPTVAPHASLYIDEVVGPAKVTDALGNLLALAADALKFLACGLRLLCELLPACGYSWERPGRRF
jgi:hypothetical protein